ncbi:MAG: ribonuclease III [Gammaproteobacteria bacterium]|nr:ribonuclease III [Gammaproteobacteria bacterium]HJL96447.1 ribonuclease III [SAR86 cluster bacterium]|tara:strand:+ start:10848 stop:11501 length:654 start_codon:yes stop_codon:yes gene_type:complete
MKELSLRIGYTFKNNSLFELALTHKSFSRNHNERLEFLGDAVLTMYVTHYLYEKFDSLSEGKLTQFKASIVSRDNLDQIAKNIGLHNYIKIGKGENLRNNSIQGNALEALIGAIYLDSSYIKTSEILKGLLGDELFELEETKDLKDAKSKLQEILQKENKQLPKYSIASKGSKEKGGDFEVTCLIEDLDLVTTGKGKNKKKAELDAANKALINLNIL